MYKILVFIFLCCFAYFTYLHRLLCIVVSFTLMEEFIKHKQLLSVNFSCALCTGFFYCFHCCCCCYCFFLCLVRSLNCFAAACCSVFFFVFLDLLYAIATDMYVCVYVLLCCLYYFFFVCFSY